MNGPSITELLSKFVETRLSDVHVCLPARVESFDRVKSKVSVKPLIKYVPENGDPVSLPVLSDIPVVFPRGAASGLFFSVSKGDFVSIVFAERSLEEWLLSGSESTPRDKRQHDLTDAIAYPGLVPFSTSPLSNKDGDAGMVNGSGRFTINKNGKLAITDGVEDLISLISQIAQGLVDATVITQLGAQPLVNAATFVALKSKLDSMKGTP